MDTFKTRREFLANFAIKKIIYYSGHQPSQHIIFELS